MAAIVSLLVAFAGYSILAIAQAGQKIGLKVAQRRKARGLTIWVLSTLSMPSSAFLILYAVSLGDASLVGAMSGSGLASLAVFSHLYMHEQIFKRELIGVLIIVCAAILIGLFHLQTVAQVFLLNALYIYLPAVCGTYLLLWLICRKKEHIVGIIIAGLSGAIGGFVPLFQKVSTSSFGRSRGLLHFHIKNQTGLATLLQKGANLFTNPWALSWIAISLLSMVVMQFAYRRGKAIQLIPAFAANTIIIPVIGGVIAFGERLHPFQWIGVVLILAGVLILTIKTEQLVHSPPKRP
jgi:uncharacterized membrane protein